MIRLDHVNKFYRNTGETVHVLKDIDITFEETGMTFILGKSGSGKSTLLNVIGGIDDFDSGDVFIEGNSIKEMKKRTIEKYRSTYTGFVFQEFNVLKGLNVFDNIHLALDLHGERMGSREKVMQIIDRVGLTGLEKRFPNQISGGQKQRVAIARALVKEPKVIIADEPTGNLDNKNRDIVMDLLKSLSKECLVIVVTHDVFLARKYATRILEIKDGAIMSDTSDNATILEIRHNVNFKEVRMPLASSYKLGLKNMWLHRFRYLMMILLFFTSLTFAGLVTNMFLANATEEYAIYQNEHNNDFVSLKTVYSNGSFSNHSAFYNFNIDDLLNDFSHTNVWKAMNYSFTIAEFSDNFFYRNTINRIHVVEDPSDISLLHGVFPSGSRQIAITDYVAQSLLHYEYFPAMTTFPDLLYKEIIVPDSNINLQIVGIVDTNFELFQSVFPNDPMNHTAFLDNLVFYNSVFMTANTLKNFASNLNAIEDTVIYRALGESGMHDSIRIQKYNLDEDVILIGREPRVPLEGQPIQMAASLGFLQDVIGLTGSPQEIYDFINYIFIDDSGLEIFINSTFYLAGVSKTPVTTYFIITGIIDEALPVVYSEPSLFSPVATSQLVEGSFLTYVSDGDVQTHAKDYQMFLMKNYLVENLSFTKVILVNDFLNQNLYLFVGLFFIFGLFSILLIFNFVIVNIKNSARDIGIYMSLGMSGSRISLIYLFQVIVVGFSAYLLSILGTFLFLLTIDNNFRSLSVVNLQILKLTPLGLIIIFAIAIFVPLSAVAVPLFALSRQRPVDVIKTN